MTSSRYFLVAILPMLVTFGCGPPKHRVTRQSATIAEQYFRAVYSGDVELVEELTADDVVVSYPVFQRVFNKPALEGRQDVAAFSRRFSSRWADREITIHDTLTDGDDVAIIWSFRARPTDTDGLQSGGSPYDDDKGLRDWGGISIVRLNSAGKIVAEFGEESEPGPMGRMDQAE
ncbi:MAG: nuclear transport factor 2 family protein [Phycisphaerae bacterium]